MARPDQGVTRRSGCIALAASFERDRTGSPSPSNPERSQPARIGARLASHPRASSKRSRVDTYAAPPMRPTAASFAGSMCMRSFASASSTRTCTTRPNLLQDAEARARREVHRRSREAKPLRPPRPPRGRRHARVDLQRVPRQGLRDLGAVHGRVREEERLSGTSSRSLDNEAKRSPTLWRDLLKNASFA